MGEQYYDLTPQQERLVLVGLMRQKDTPELIREYLDELAFLVDTAGGKVEKMFVQKRDKPDSAHYVGRGKLAEIKTYIAENEIQTAVFDDELSPSQIRNLEKELGCKILDRTHLILDIFASRARTAQSKTQVELAQYQYLLPRLTRMWTHLERQKGGIGLRGPGETEIETDRRIIRDKIALLKKKLENIDKQNEIQRKKRAELVRVALVGYTNVGKSTIMNLISKSDIFAENKLFATLDTTVRKVVFDNLPFLLSDTVGFIRKLPHGLVESFKSTLDEVREADIILHVVDISHPNFEEQIQVVNQTLTEIEVIDKPTMMIFNKIDAFTYVKKEADDLTPAARENHSLDELKRTWMARENLHCLFISARKKTNVDTLREELYAMAKAIHIKRYPYNNLLY